MPTCSGELSGISVILQNTVGFIVNILFTEANPATFKLYTFTFFGSAALLAVIRWIAKADHYTRFPASP